MTLRRQAAKFLAATDHCRETQHDVLQGLLRLNEDSRFSQEHRLSEATPPETFRKRLPIADYEAFRSYVEQLKDGHHDALLGARNRLLMFTLSSGTTANAKFIPITERFFSDYRRGWQTWGIRAYDAHPALHAKNIVQLTSDDDQFRTAGGTPCGNISGLAAAMQRRIVRFMYTVPSTVSKIGDPDAKYYTVLRLAVADDNVGLVMTANPSTLVHLARFGDQRKEELIRDIADGTLSRKYSVDDSLRKKMPRRIGRADRKRARQLEAVVQRTGHLYPRNYWPSMDILAVWLGGSCAAYLSSLRGYYGGVALRDHGLSASEGRMTIPLEDERSEGVLDITSHYFEFIPEAEYGKDAPTVLEAHELREGDEYYILLTTSSGLYRYDICDVVRCVGFCGTTPVLRFLHKGAHIANVTGEKISESQVVDAVRACVEEKQLKVQFFAVAPTWGEPPRYQLLVEENDLPSREVGEQLALAVDRQLQALNCEYNEKRKTARLAPLECAFLRPGTWTSFAQQRQSRVGGSVEQYKHPCLIPDLEFVPRFLTEHATGSGAVESPPAP